MNGATRTGGINGGGAVELSYGGGYVDMGDRFAFGGTTPFSIQAWVNLPLGDTQPDTRGMIPVSRHLSGAPDGYFLAVNDVGDGAGGTNLAHAYQSGPSTPLSSIVINDGQWHQIVGVYDTGTTSLYVDGTFESSASRVSITSFPGVHFLVGAITVGGNPFNLFNGAITDVGVWDNALSPADVESLYNSVATPEPSTLALVGIAGLGALGRRRSRRRQS